MVLAPPSELPHSFVDWPFFFAADAEEARELAAELDLEQREILEPHEAGRSRRYIITR